MGYFFTLKGWEQSELIPLALLHGYLSVYIQGDMALITVKTEDSIAAECVYNSIKIGVQHTDCTNLFVERPLSGNFLYVYSWKDGVEARIPYDIYYHHPKRAISA